MWLVFALLAPFFFALVHVLDEYCVDNVLERPWMGVVTSAATSGISYFAIPFLLPFIDFSHFDLNLILLSIFAGILIQTSQFFYFNALSFSEAGIVSAYWNLIPAMLPIVSYFLFSEVLQPIEYGGIAVLIFASTAMSMLDYHYKTRNITFFLMLVAAVMQVIAYLLMNHLYANQDFFITYFSVVTGIIITGIAPLFFRVPRSALVSAIPKLKGQTRFFVIIEAANLLGLAAAQLAIKLGDPSLVSAAETTMPAFTFLISIPWIRYVNGSQKALWDKFASKMLVVALMVFGVWMIS